MIGRMAHGRAVSVKAGLVPAIHAAPPRARLRAALYASEMSHRPSAWSRGTSPDMTAVRVFAKIA